MINIKRMTFPKPTFYFFKLQLMLAVLSVSSTGSTGSSGPPTAPIESSQRKELLSSESGGRRKETSNDNKTMYKTKQCFNSHKTGSIMKPV